MKLELALDARDLQNKDKTTNLENTMVHAQEARQGVCRCGKPD